jgi:hypothetical protein
VQSNRTHSRHIDQRLHDPRPNLLLSLASFENSTQLAQLLNRTAIINRSRHFWKPVLAAQGTWQEVTEAVLLTALHARPPTLPPAMPVEDVASLPAWLQCVWLPPQQLALQRRQPKHCNRRVKRKSNQSML